MTFMPYFLTDNSPETNAKADSIRATFSLKAGKPLTNNEFFKALVEYAEACLKLEK